MKVLADFQPPAGGKFWGSDSLFKNPPLFVPDLEQGGGVS